ncbi:hypothetical protein SAMN06272735_2986 [Streptomyces sp. TLI_55]|uniref:hypothetical protein n=1 Tax=Streptomyces sp. TLI_55 TaxID=1938861 RepID=UPI000BCC28F3|nr:hypothetical protein [Streptomyces sp. TLI_55]SNX58490.1 hypothetical protein SAMN06272735_2986 [Streptomyces sp. TLI_55]
MTAEHRDVDALMAALTGEPLPDDADAALRAEHRAASDDITLLREQLGLIGDALAHDPRPAPRPAPVRPSRVRVWAPRLAFGTLVAAAVASVVTGLGWLVATGGNDSADAGSSASDKSQVGAQAGRFGSPHYLACTRLVVEGKVASVERLADQAQLRITVDVDRYYKQDTKGPKRLTYVVDDNFVDGLHQGDPVLFGVPQGDAVPDHWVVGEQEVARERAWVQASLPESRKLTC